MRKNGWFLFCFMVLALAAVASARTYRWVDEHGGFTRFYDSPLLKGSNTPAETASPAKVQPEPSLAAPSALNFSNENSPDTSSLLAGQEEPAEPREITVELYSASWCFYCKDARKFFLSRGIPFSEYDVEKDEKAARRKEKLAPGRGLPVVVICGQKICGFWPEAYEKALESCGK